MVGIILTLCEMLFTAGRKLIPVELYINVASRSVGVPNDHIVTTNVLRSTEEKLRLFVRGQGGWLRTHSIVCSVRLWKVSDRCLLSSPPACRLDRCWLELSDRSKGFVRDRYLTFDRVLSPDWEWCVLHIYGQTVECKRYLYLWMNILDERRGAIQQTNDLWTVDDLIVRLFECAPHDRCSSRAIEICPIEIFPDNARCLSMNHYWLSPGFSGRSPCIADYARTRIALENSPWGRYPDRFWQRRSRCPLTEANGDQNQEFNESENLWVHRLAERRDESQRD